MAVDRVHHGGCVHEVSSEKSERHGLHNVDTNKNYDNAIRKQSLSLLLAKVVAKKYLSQHMTKPTIILVPPTKTKISLRIHAVWSVFADRIAFYSLWAIQRGINENPCHTGWMYRLIWVFAGHTGRSYCRFLVRQHTTKPTIRPTCGYPIYLEILTNCSDLSPHVWLDLQSVSQREQNLSFRSTSQSFREVKYTTTAKNPKNLYSEKDLTD